MEPYIFAFLGNREVRNRKAVLDSLCFFIESVCFCDPNISYPVFYCGGYGEFSQLASEAIDIVRKEKPDLYSEKLFISPYNTPTYLKTLESVKDYYDEIVYPPLESVPAQFAIVRRNQWMVDRCDMVVTHMWNPIGNTKKLINYAVRKAKEIYYIK